jgi:hypothetical protein
MFGLAGSEIGVLLLVLAFLALIAFLIYRWGGGRGREG